MMCSQNTIQQPFHINLPKASWLFSSLISKTIEEHDPTTKNFKYFKWTLDCLDFCFVFVCGCLEINTNDKLLQHIKCSEWLPLPVKQTIDTHLQSHQVHDSRECVCLCTLKFCEWHQNRFWMLYNSQNWPHHVNMFGIQWNASHGKSYRFFP